MTKLKNAPNVKKQPVGKPYGAYVIAGSEAWNNEKRLAVLEWTKAEKGYEPIILGETQLAEIGRLKMAVDVGKVSIFRAGKLSEASKSAICKNLAVHSTAEIVAFYDEALQLEEDASAYIGRIRAGDSLHGAIDGASGGGSADDSESVRAKLGLSDSPSSKERLEGFLKWHDQPLARDGETETNYAFNGLIWEKLHKEAVERLVMAFFEAIDFDYTPHRISSLAKLVERKIPQMRQSSSDIIGFLNGKINKLTGEFSPIEPSDYLLEIEDYAVNAHSTATPHFNQWLEFVSNGDEEKRRAFLAALYAVLTNRYKWQLYFEAVGVAGSGKSVFGEIAKVINGRANTTILDIASFDEPTELAKIIGKSLVLSPEQPYYCGNADGLKSATGGEMVAVRVRYSQGTDCYPKIIFIFSTNNAVTFTDNRGGAEHSGHARRRVTFYFGRKVPDEVRDEDFLAKVKSEIYGIIHRLLDEFSTPEEAQAVLKAHQARAEFVEMQKENNHLINFASHFKIDNAKPSKMRWGSARTTLNEQQALYRAYGFFCDCIGQKPLSVHHFKKAFPEALRASGEAQEIIERTLHGNAVINVFYKDYARTISEWQDG